MIPLKQDFIIKNHDGSFMTYPKDKFEIKPRISHVVDEEINIDLRLVDKEGNTRNHVCQLFFRDNNEEFPYEDAIKHLDNGKLKPSGVKWLREQTIPNIDLKQFI